MPAQVFKDILNRVLDSYQTVPPLGNQIYDFSNGTFTNCKIGIQGPSTFGHSNDSRGETTEPPPTRSDSDDSSIHNAGSTTFTNVDRSTNMDNRDIPENIQEQERSFSSPTFAHQLHMDTNQANIQNFEFFPPPAKKPRLVSSQQGTTEAASATYLPEDAVQQQQNSKENTGLSSVKSHLWSPAIWARQNISGSARRTDKSPGEVHGNSYSRVRQEDIKGSPFSWQAAAYLPFTGGALSARNGNPESYPIGSALSRKNGQARGLQIYSDGSPMASSHQIPFGKHSEFTASRQQYYAWERDNKTDI